MIESPNTCRAGIAESVPYPEGSFDFAISEYGAALWADPCEWIPEAARILKPGGQLVFLTHSPLAVACMPDYEKDGPVRPELLRSYFGMHAIVWPDAPGETMFNLTHGGWIALLRANGFTIERLIEMRAPPGSTTEYDWADPDWGAQWPIEDAWVARKASGA
jgi:SAM-dependent methyltransferase